ncbi:MULTISPECIES: GNAT family N-acetyltransferase [Niastella]|uniref:GNAT family N-acetyltransferase n=1 Tax=Niastella soli TaxID=2821487 RepID=A0ABS3YMT2_9BACT|nr:GNAT family N-acetyltransferase [Niastella soli]MBO9199201.1 GNAT family N-acetyltransferase [Niastella soli]
MIWHKDNYTINTDKATLSLEYIHQYLSEQSYWAKGIPLHTVKRSIENAICFGVYKDAQMVGFARVITDCATFGYLADVFIDETCRGEGLSKWLMEVILTHPDLQGLRRFMLATRDAHGLYRQFDFTELANPEYMMAIVKQDVYKTIS